MGRPRRRDDSNLGLTVQRGFYQRKYTDVQSFQIQCGFVSFQLSLAFSDSKTDGHPPEAIVMLFLIVSPAFGFGPCIALEVVAVAAVVALTALPAKDMIT